MAVQNVLPTLAAEEKSAHLNLRAVHIPNGLADTGRLLSDAGNGLQKAAAGLMLGLKRQRDEMNEREDALALAQAKVNYSRDTTKGMTELLKRSGAEAKGITNEYETMSRNARDRWTETLSPRAAREFQIWTDQQNLAGWQKVQGHEYSSVRGAQVDMGKQTISSSVQSFSITGSVFDLDAALQAHDDVYGLVNGNVGEAYDILKRDDESAPEAKLTAEERSGVETRVKVYEKSRQNVIDQALGARMQYLLEQGDIYGASVFFNSFGKNGIAPSKEAETVMRGVLEKKQESLMLQYDASALVNDVLAAAGGESLGGQFTTPEQVQAAAQVEKRLSESTDPKDKERLSNFRNMYGAKLKEQSANLAVGISSNTHDLFQNFQDLNLFASSLSVLKSRIDNMPPSMLRDELESMYAKYNKAYLSDVKTRMNEMQTAANKLQTLANSERTEQKRKLDEYKKDPARIAYAGALLNQACLSNPSITIGSGYSAKTFYLRDEQQCAAAVSYLNMRNGGPLTDEECWQLQQLGSGRMVSQDRLDATARVGRLFQSLGYEAGDNPSTIAMAAPWLIDYAIKTAQRYTNDGKIKGKEVSDAIDRAILEELDREFSAPSWFWGFGNGGRAFFPTARIIDEAIKGDGTIDFDYLEKSFGNFANPSSTNQAKTNPDVDRRINEERTKRELGIFAGRGTTPSDFAEQQRGVK